MNFSDLPQSEQSHSLTISDELDLVNEMIQDEERYEYLNSCNFDNSFEEIVRGYSVNVGETNDVFNNLVGDYLPEILISNNDFGNDNEEGNYVLDEVIDMEFEAQVPGPPPNQEIGSSIAEVFNQFLVDRAALFAARSNKGNKASIIESAEAIALTSRAELLAVLDRAGQVGIKPMSSLYGPIRDYVVSNNEPNLLLNPEPQVKVDLVFHINKQSDGRSSGQIAVCNDSIIELDLKVEEIPPTDDSPQKPVIIPILAVTFMPMGQRNAANSAACTCFRCNLPFNLEKQSWLANENNLTCRLCKKFFGTPSNLRKHLLRMHLNLGSFKCTHCTATFVSNALLGTHKKDVHDSDTNLLICTRCNRAWSCVKPPQAKIECFPGHFWLKNKFGEFGLTEVSILSVPPKDLKGDENHSYELIYEHGYLMGRTKTSKISLNLHELLNLVSE